MSFNEDYFYSQHKKDVEYYNSIHVAQGTPSEWGPWTHPSPYPIPDPKTLRDERGDRYASITISDYMLHSSSQRAMDIAVEVREQLHRMGVRGEIRSTRDAHSNSTTIWGRIDPMCEPVQRKDVSTPHVQIAAMDKKRFIKLEGE